jgi:5-methylcytosine-specific restriction protein B
MNTADRSIALVDHALRRRFAFFRLQPDYSVLRRFHERRATGVAVEGLIDVLQTVNREINDPNYEIGVSFFLDEDLEDHLEDIWRMEIEPYLEEYFFDRRPKVEALRWERVRERLATSP